MSERNVVLKITTVPDSRLGDPFRQLTTQALAAERQGVSSIKSIQEQFRGIERTAQTASTSVANVGQVTATRIGTEANRAVQQYGSSWATAAKQIDQAAHATERVNTATNKAATSTGNLKQSYGMILGIVADISRIGTMVSHDAGLVRKTSNREKWGKQEALESQGFFGMMARTTDESFKAALGKDFDLEDPYKSMPALEGMVDVFSTQGMIDTRDRLRKEKADAAARQESDLKAAEAASQEEADLGKRFREVSGINASRLREAAHRDTMDSASGKEGDVRTRVVVADQLKHLDTTLVELEAKKLGDSRLALGVLEQHKRALESMAAIEERAIGRAKQANQERIDGLRKQMDLAKGQADQWDRITAQERGKAASAQMQFGLMSSEEQQQTLDVARRLQGASSLQGFDPAEIQRAQGLNLFDDKIRQLAAKSAQEGGFGELLQLSGASDRIQNAERMQREAEQSRVNIEKQINVQLVQDQQAIADLIVQQLGPLVQKSAVTDDTIRLIQDRLVRQQEINAAMRGPLTE